jgi:hypothetical protein
LNFASTTANRNHIFSILNFGKWTLKLDASLTNNEGEKIESSFLKHKFDFGRNIGKFKIGIKEESEKNLMRIAKADSLLKNSFSYQEIGAYVITNQAEKNTFNLEYKHRYDKLPALNRLVKANQSNEIISELGLLKNKANILKVKYTFRELEVLDTNLSSTKSDKNSLGRLEHNLNILKGAIRINSFFESGTAMEIKREYSYIEVAHGQGNYSWTDYNENGIKELDEFEIAVFQDQANYLRVTIPTNDFIKTYLSSFSTSINLNPHKIWSKSENGFKKLLSKFSNNFSLRNSKKSTTADFSTLLNPVYSNVDNSDLMRLDFNAKNILSFNRLSSKFSANLILTKNTAKSIITNGAEFRSIEELEFDFRWSLNKKIMLMPVFNIGEKSRDSEFSANRFYQINYKSIMPVLNIQPSRVFRLRFSYKYQNKENNSVSNETAIINDFGLNIKYNKLKKSSVQLSFSYVNIAYDFQQNTALAFEMLDALQPGDNLLWTIGFQRTLLDNLQLNIRYQGRRPSESKIIHLGNIQVRAFF